MRILFIGDIVGSPGRRMVHDRLSDLVEHHHIEPSGPDRSPDMPKTRF